MRTLDVLSMDAGAGTGQEGFGPDMEPLMGHSIKAVVAAIAEQVKRQSEDVWLRGSRAQRGRALLVLDGCEQFLVVGQRRVALKELLVLLFRALPSLTVAVTMRATGPSAVDSVGLQGEETIVIKGLDDRRCGAL